MGKSPLATNIAENAAVDHGRPVALFSLEMSEGELAQRFIASQAKISSDDLRKGRVEGRPLAEGRCRRPRSSRRRRSSSTTRATSACSSCAPRRGGCTCATTLGLLIVDYLQLMRPEDARDSRVEQVGKISRGLKILARELRHPGDRGLAALARGRVAHPTAPMLSDLRESGNIEQDADLVMFVYRDEYYNKEIREAGRGRRDHRQAPQRPGRSASSSRS